MPDKPVKINIEEIPAIEGWLIGKTFAAFVEKFYENPENHEKFKAWKMQREAQSV